MRERDKLDKRIKDFLALPDRVRAVVAAPIDVVIAIETCGHGRLSCDKCGLRAAA